METITSTSNSTSTSKNTSVETIESRIAREGYGPGAWHGADLSAALTGVTPAQAYWRPGVGRHNIAEIALHHAYCVRGVRAQLSGQAAEPFVLTGEDWFTLDDERALPWQTVLDSVKAEHERLGDLVGPTEGSDARAPLSAEERLTLVLGITCHAIYHAGQIQLIKRLRGE